MGEEGRCRIDSSAVQTGERQASKSKGRKKRRSLKLGLWAVACVVCVAVVVVVVVVAAVVVVAVVVVARHGSLVLR